MLFSQATYIHKFIAMSEGVYQVHSTFEHAINLELPARREFFSIVTAQKPLVPQGMKLDVMRLPFVAQGERAFFDGTRFSIGDLVIETKFAQVMDLKIQPYSFSSNTVEDELDEMRAWFDIERACLNPGIAEFNDSRWQEQLMQRLQKEGLESVVASLIGRGPGLTPSGDDFICGWLWLWTRVHHRERSKLLEAVANRWQTTTPISENFLRLMGVGYALEALKIAEKNFSQGFAFMRQQGASSGQDTLCGIDFALQLLH